MTTMVMRLGAVVLLCAAVLVVVLSRRPESSEPAAPREQSIVFSGLHASTTDAFFLPGGSYRATWSAWGEVPNEPPCTHSIALVVANTSRQLVKSVQVPATGVTGNVDLTDLEPGDYAFDIRSACAWSIELKQRE